MSTSSFSGLPRSSITTTNRLAHLPHSLLFKGRCSLVNEAPQAQARMNLQRRNELG
jgi:hypothetical protein